MENAYYVLSKENVEIERLHICTWEFPGSSSYIEFGIEFKYEDFVDDDIAFYLAAPFVKKDEYCVKEKSENEKVDKTKKKITCLLDKFTNDENGRFIFNAVVNEAVNIDGDSRNGRILKFEGRPALTILPCEITIENGYFLFKIKKPDQKEGNLYFRVLIEIGNNSIAIVKKGIAQKTYIYDLKINETRNLPQSIYKLKKKEELSVCKVKVLFCLHSIPDDFELSFVNSKKLKNVRKLEASVFQKYLPEIKKISKDCYNIMFLKDQGEESYSLFSICTEEMIGSKQIAFAVGANILCSLLFAISSLRFIRDSTIEWYKQIPLEYWFALGVLIIVCVYMFYSLKKKS